MADIKVGIILDGSNVKGQAAKVGSDVRQGVQGTLTSKSSAQVRDEWQTRQAVLVRQANQAFRQRAAATAAAAAVAARRQQMASAAASAAGAFGGRFGLSGVTTAVRAGPVGIAIATVVAGLLALGKSIQNILQAIESARQMYAKQLTSGGLPGGFVTGRSVLAQVIGVGERDVLQYGSAVQYLNEQIKLSVAEINRTNRTLTATAWSFKVVGVNFDALWAQLAAAMAPLFQTIAKFTAALIEFVRETGVAEGAFKLVQVGLLLIVRAMQLVVFNASAFVLGMVAIGDAIQYFLRQVNNSMARSPIGAAMGFKVDKSNPFEETIKGWKALQKMTAAFKRGNVEGVQVPDASTSYKRLQASPWEKMGLVVGAGAGSNPLNATARNTKKSADLLEKIKTFLAPRSSKGSPILPATAASSA